MNILPGVISEIQSTEHMSYIKVDLAEEDFIKTVILETSRTLSYLQLNQKVKILFKETEVILSQVKIERSNLENSIRGIVRKIDRGDIFTRIEIGTASGRICSIVTTRSFDPLSFSIGDSIVASINSNEIMLAE